MSCSRFPKYFIAALLSILPAQTFASDPLSADDVKEQNFSFITRMYYNSTIVNDIKTVNVMVAAKMGRTEQAAQAFAALGGKTLERYDDVGYFWGSLPSAQLPKLLDVPDIVTFQLDIRPPVLY